MPWITDEFGTRRFTHDGWTITVFPPGTGNRIHIDPSGRGDWDVEICADDGEITVLGESTSGYYTTPSRVYIPLVVMREIIAAYDECSASSTANEVE